MSIIVERKEAFKIFCYVCKDNSLFYKDHAHAICTGCGTLHRETKTSHGNFYNEIILPQGFYSTQVGFA